MQVSLQKSHLSHIT